MATQTWLDILSVEDLERVTDVPSQVSAAIQPQFAHAKVIGALAALFQKEVDATRQLEEIYKNIANPATCSGVFLDWLGTRVGASRQVTLSTGTYFWDDETFRFLVYLKALSNISDASAATMNDMISKLVGIQFLVVDNLDMTISLRFFGELTEQQLFVLKTYGILNRGAGVGYDITTNFSTNVFGFSGSGLQPFNQAPFGNLMVQNNE